MAMTAAQQYADEEARTEPVKIIPRNWKTQKQAKEELQKLLDTNDRAVYRALLVIYSKQTEYEKNAGATVADNGVGFGAFDAEFLTDMVASLKEYGRLTPKQLAITRNKMKHYWKQLMKIAKGEL